MDNIGEIVFAILFLLFTVFGFVKRTAEGRDVAKRNQESDRTPQDLPEETRRMLFGGPGAPMAKPAQPKRNPDPFVEVREVFNEMRRQFEPKIAKPKQGAPRPQQLPAAPPPVPQAPRQAHPMQPQFRPAQQQARPATPPRQAPRPQPPRMVPQQSEGAMPRQAQPQRPLQRQRPAARLMEPDEGPTMPIYRAKQDKPRVRAKQQHSRWITNHDDLRRGIILSEILGPPKALRDS